MKLRRLNAFLFLSLASLVFGTSVWARVSTLTWNSFVLFSFYYDSSVPNTSDIVSRFTPAQAIAVTRIEVHAAQGSQRSAPGQNFPCTKPVSFKITDGEQNFTLPFPSAAKVITGGYNSSSADSGPLDLAFPAGAKIVLSVIEGDPFEPSTGKSPCFANSVNITVQYKVNSHERNKAHPEQKEEEK
jgi:hypothetical protein